jgi:uncharacterized repeat protein (TIGR03803 family)
VRKLSFWRTTSLLCLFCVAAATGSPAQTFNSLSLDGTTGIVPLAPLVQGTDGNFYGTTFGEGDVGYGTVFKITLAGMLTTLYNFCSQAGCTDGQSPSAGLVLGTDGNFYGTTEYGGNLGAGTVFKITPGGTLTTLHSFCAQTGCTDGAYPYASLIEGTDGNFYGTTLGGGLYPPPLGSECYVYGTSGDGCGTVFKITPGGTLTTLYSFCSQLNNYGCADGALPYGSLVQGADGNFYGTTVIGGAEDCSAGGCGTVFKITPSGTLNTLHSFCSQAGCSDGTNPKGGLVQGSDGNFYGTTLLWGTHDGGTVFMMTPAGQLTTLYDFCSRTNCTDGGAPEAGLIQATDGNFYGTTYGGGANSGGTVFKITRGGRLTTLYSFCSQTNCTDGENPYDSLVQGTGGEFGGTTYAGGDENEGTVFGLSVGLGPFVRTLPASGKVGSSVIILGNNLTGATSVTFNGTLATFTVKSSTEITTTVPSGATAGYVKVTTASGKILTSNLQFRVP